MTTPIGSIACSNPHCGHINPATTRACSACGAPLALVHLYAIGPTLQGLQAGDWVGNRYFYLGDRCFLDGKPTEPPDVPTEVTRATLNYLRLFEYRPQIPQIYGITKHASTGREPIMLLEGAPIAPDGTLLPRLVDHWPQQSPLRQLNWLWQLARLWEPLQAAHSSATLSDPDRLRVGGGWVRLLSLKDNAGRSHSLAEWARWWVQKLLPHPMIEPVVMPLLQQVALGRMDAATLATALEQAIEQWARQDLPVPVASATLSDPGPSRSRNEDACYPPSPGQSAGQRFGLAIVCDGLGGHEGGDVASQLAIELLASQLVPFVKQAAAHPPSSATVTQALMEAIATANSAITQRNNDEGRSERQRMGTTLVLALMIERSLYLAHVGDSRAYQVTATGCQLLTLDDDLATRESRLGLGFYRDLLQVGSAGALVQALGMGPSENLSPTVRHLVLDEDCEIVLCSDGVSDFDLVERSWRELFLPSLGDAEAVTTVEQAIALANHHNGHDNATIALLQIRAASQVLPSRPMPAIAPPLSPEAGSAMRPPEPIAANQPLVATVIPAAINPPQSETRSALDKRRRQRAQRPHLAPWLAGLAGLITVGGLLALGVGPLVRQMVNGNSPPTPPPPSAPAPSNPGSPSSPVGSSPPAAGVAPSASPAAPQAGVPLLVKAETGAISLYQAAGSTTNSNWLPTNSIIQILGTVTESSPTATSPDQPGQPSPATAVDWVQIKICQAGPTTNPSPLGLKGDTFFVRAADLPNRTMPLPADRPNPCPSPVPSADPLSPS